MNAYTMPKSRAIAEEREKVSKGTNSVYVHPENGPSFIKRSSHFTGVKL